MNRFIKNSLVFFLLASGCIVGLIILSDYAQKKAAPRLLKLRSNISIVFAGDSNVESAINDDLIPNSVNIASSGEAYLYSYVKIKALLKNNSQIRTVFISYSPEKLNKFTEERWLFNEEFIIEKLKVYNYLLTGPEKGIMIRRNSLAYFKGLLQSVPYNISGAAKGYLNSPPHDNILNFGGYQYLIRNKLGEDIDRQNGELENEAQNKMVGKGEYQERYLGMISDLCNQRSVKLILLSTPKYHPEPGSIPGLDLGSNPGFTSFHIRDSILDMSEFHLPDSCFADISHLNYKGARLYSEYLNNYLINTQRE